jgi:hypothetical protein
MNKQPHVNVVLWDNAWECPPVLLAHRTLLNEMLKYGFVCETSQKSMWRQFISDFLMEILVYGYCVFRTAGGGRPQIALGRMTEIVTSDAGGTWRPRVFDANYSALRATKGWKVLVHDRPATDAMGAYKHPTSSMFRALPAVIQYRILVSNMMRRDMANSIPTVYTTISNNIGVNPSTSRPWFNSVHSAMGPSQVTGRVDFRALVQHRSDTIESLRRLTEQARRNQASSVGPGNTAASAEDAGPNHSEHMVTDGRDAREVRHLQQDNEIVHFVTERTGFVIFQLLGVPPQVLGQNINSERLASSNRLTEMSIQHFQLHCAVLKQLIETVIDIYKFKVQFGDCVALSTVRAVEQFVKPARLAEMYACALDLNTDDFDLDRIRDYQFSLVPTHDLATRSPRTLLTEDEKDEKRKRKVGAVD